MAKRTAYKVGDSVIYNGIQYQIETTFKGLNGIWVTLKDRVGNVHTTELKSPVKR